MVRGLTALAVVLGLTVAPAHGQSLGEIAAREAQRRAAIAASRMLLNPAPETAAPSSAPAPASRAAVAVPAVMPPAEPRRAPVAPAAEAPTVSITTGRITPEIASAVQPASAPSATLAGWSAFQIKKTTSELAESERLTALTDVIARTRPSDVRLPPQQDALLLSTGLSYLQGTDWGGDLSATGKINGMQTDISGFFTAGPMGFETQSGRLSIFMPNGRWRGEAGDLYSDLRGLARGARGSWNVGRKWTPSISVFVPRAAAGERVPVAAYRDRIQLLPAVRLGGELATDGARFLQLQYAAPRGDATGFYRFVPGIRGGRDQGVSGGLRLWRAVAVTGALRVSDAVDDSRRWQMASVRLPLPGHASVTLERSWWTATLNGGSINAVALQLPLGPLRFIQRVQWGHTDYLQRAVPYGFDRRQSQSTASYSAGRWAHVNYQQSTQWFADGRLQQWDELASVVQLGRRTTAQFVTAFPDLADPRRLRARVTHQLSPTLALEAQFGRLSAFQRSVASASETSRFMLTVRKTWQLETPARGGDVRGQALDQAGVPVAGALVRLGPYSTITDERGAYAFTRVPDSQLDLSLDKDKLPAAYALDEIPRRLAVARGVRTTANLQVIPLNAIRGRVYQDLNLNGRFDDGEGLGNAVIAVNDSVTATTSTGTYAFYNQPPGRYRIRLDLKRLPKGLAALSPPELDVELTASQPLLGADFLIQKKDMPIIMRDTRR